MVPVLAKGNDRGLRRSIEGPAHRFRPDVGDRLDPREAVRDAIGGRGFDLVGQQPERDGKTYSAIAFKDSFPA
jgi:hypothetical protein